MEMALKFVQTGGAGNGGSGSGTYDHNLLVNRGMPDQHTIDAVTGLRTALASKYEKPFSGIPKSDLGFDVATLHDIDVFRNTDLADVVNNLSIVALEILEARGTEDTLREYIDTKVPYSEYTGGSGGGGSSAQIGYPMYEEYRAIDGQRIFPLTKTFRMGTHQLEVYLDGLRMVENDDYREVDDHTVEFLFDAEEGDLLLFMVRAIISSGLHEEYTALEGQTVFPLQNPYAIHMNTLQVFRNGNLLRKGRDYAETDAQTIAFIRVPQAGDLITFHQAGSADPLSGTAMESEIGRMKINHGYTTFLLQEATHSERTDYIDMYVDTFVTDTQIDQVKSFGYDYLNESIFVKDLSTALSTLEDFQTGVISDTDITTYPDTIILRTTPGGAENNTFEPYDKVLDVQLNEILAFTNNRHEDFLFYAEELPDGSCVLRVQKQATTISLNTTDGSFFSLSADQDNQGNIHLVYHEQGSITGKPRVHYLKVNAVDVTAENHQVVSDQSQDAITPDVYVDEDNKAHITFSSKRINANYFNIDYRMIEGMTISGFKDVTVYTTVDALNPRIAVGKDKIARVVFDSTAFDNVTKNIRYVTINNGVNEYAEWLTTSTTYDNVQADIDIDEYDNAKIVWKSKRISANYGIDFSSVSSSHVATSVKSIANGTFICDSPKVAVDPENIAHVVFHANLTRDDHDNICYAYVYADSTVAPFQDIASVFGTQFRFPDVQIYGGWLLVSFLGDTNGYQVKKSLANYTGIGRFDYVFDSKAEDSSWHDIYLDAVVPVGTAYSIEYRISNDQTVWSSWSDISSIATDETVGRYLHTRITLTSTDVLITPSIEAVHINYRPSFIEVQSAAKVSTKDVDTAILIAKYDGVVTFQVSRDDGTVFTDAEIEKSVNLLNKPQGNNLVIKAKIIDGSRLDAWGILW